MAFFNSPTSRAAVAEDRTRPIALSHHRGSPLPCGCVDPRKPSGSQPWLGRFGQPCGKSKTFCEKQIAADREPRSGRRLDRPRMPHLGIEWNALGRPNQTHARERTWNPIRASRCGVRLPRESTANIANCERAAGHRSRRRRPCGQSRSKHRRRSERFFLWILSSFLQQERGR